MNGRLQKIMCFLFILTIVSQYAAAYTPDEAFEYTIANNQVTITKFIGSQTDISIPPTIEEKPVVAIGQSAFYNHDELMSVTIPEGVISIGHSAFQTCDNLISVTIPSSVTSIDYDAFIFCSSLVSITLDEGNDYFIVVDGILFNKSMTTLVCYPAGKTGTQYSIPSGVTTIATGAFGGCRSLLSVTIPEGVTSIGSRAFGICTSLSTVAIPSSVMSISSSAFNSCTSLTSIVVDATNAYYASVDGILFNKSKTTLVRYPPAKTDTEYSIPSSVTAIGGSAFDDCRNLTNVMIPSTVGAIGNDAFYYCSSLTHVIIPEGVTAIGSYVFSYCRNMTSVTIPSTVKTIGFDAFLGCSGLTSVTLPEGMTSIDNYAFGSCTSLTSVTIPSTLTTIGHHAFYNCKSLIEIEFMGPPPSLGSNSYPTPITFYVPANKGWEEWEVPDGVTLVVNTESEADYTYTIADGKVTITGYHGSATDLVIPSTIDGKPVVAIGNAAFRNNTSLTSVTIPEGVTSIGNGAFQLCSSLANITLPSSMISIGTSVFSGCSSLTSVTIPDGVTIIDNFVFFVCSSLSSVSLPSGMGSIGKFAFCNCSALTSITIPSSIDFIGPNAFQYCTSLTDMDFDGLPPIFSSACYPTPITFHVPAGKGWEDWTVPSGVTLDIRHESRMQTLELSTGWNWLSFNVLPESRKVGDVLGTEGFSPNDIIQTNGGMARFTGMSWMPGSFTVEYGKLYQIYVANDVEVVVNGIVDGPSSVPLVAGWNWIANSTLESVTSAELIHSGGWSAGDRIQSPVGTVIHTGSKWVPATGFTLESGKGYQIFTANEGTLSFQTSEYVDDDDALYVVVDISDGPDATSYPVRYTNTAPNLDDNTCRTTELWLRRIPAGSFMMGSPEDEVWRNDNETQHEVTLTQDYYVGVFECTQKQWELVMGNNPSTYKGYFCPVEGVSYDMIRGSGEQDGAGWPTYGHTVDASSFMGKLQEKTGLTFDLPTEAQWEYACRAGTTTAFNSGKNMVKNGNNDEILQVGRFGANESDGKGGHLQHTKVGCYLPNAWGLFDMHGNVYEWCLDWYGTYDTEAVEDPQGGITGSKRVWRGGGWFNVIEGSERTLGDLSDCRSASRYSCDPSASSLVGFRVVCYPKQNLYAVVDLSGGPDATSYPVRYTDTAPNLDDDTCRTTELWLRKIPAGTFMMGAQGDEVGRYDNETQHEVTLTQDFYIGVFECTQKQWELVMGSNPSLFNGDCRPVENISYEMIRGRGEQDGAGWPMYGHVVNSTSFMGKLQEKTGLMFDLPTEAQWEYACRAGTTTALNSGKNLTQPTGKVAAMNEVGRYYFNQTDGIGGYSEHTTVGSYLPNAWELYDMHGNVLEWCLDWYGGYSTNAVSDPVGPSSGSGRVVRGGSWSNYVRDCRSAGKRYGSTPWYSTDSHGFRVALLP